VSHASPVTIPAWRRRTGSVDRAGGGEGLLAAVGGLDGGGQGLLDLS